MIKKSKILLIIGFVLSNYSFSQTTVSLSPSSDNSIYSNNTSNSNGIGKLYSGATCINGNRRALLKFNLSSIPTGATITAVTLNVNADKVPSSASSDTYNVHPLTLGFGEGSSSGTGLGAAAIAPDATWNDAMFGTSTWATAGGDYTTSVSSVTMNTSTGSKIFPTSTSFVALTQAWLNTPASNFGLIMIGNESTNCNARRFGSKEQGTAPVLSITYTPPPCTPTASAFSITECTSYTVPSGDETYTIVGTHIVMDTINNAAGCDSVMTINLTIENAIDASTTTSGFTITSTQTGASYKWIDCNNGNSIISGETNQNFTATVNGSYAAIITIGSCSITSSCINISTIGINEISLFKNISIYPNPNQGIVNIDLGMLTDVTIKVSNINGELIYTQEKINTSTHQFELNESAGIYLVEVSSNNKKQEYQLVIK